MSDRLSLQAFADHVLSDDYRQPLRTLPDALYAHGWHHGLPDCCGQSVEIQSMFGDAYYAGCKCCGRFIADIAGPSFTGGAVQFLDPDRVDLDTKLRWIVGRTPTPTRGERGERR